MGEVWSDGGPIDPSEEEYCGEVWMGEIDAEAERAASEAATTAGAREQRRLDREEAKRKRDGDYPKPPKRTKTESEGVTA